MADTTKRSDWIVYDRADPSRNGAVRAGDRQGARVLGKRKFSEAGIVIPLESIDATVVFDGETPVQAKARVARFRPHT